MNGESYRLKQARARRRKAAKVESDAPTAEDTVDPGTGEITSPPLYSFLRQPLAG